MPLHPQSKAAPHVWRWQWLLELADQAGHLVPVGRGGERRAITLANSSLGGKRYATSDSDSGPLDLFRFADAPIFEALHAHRLEVTER